MSSNLNDKILITKPKKDKKSPSAAKGKGLSNDKKILLIANLKDQIKQEIKLIRAESQKISNLKSEYLKLSEKMKEEVNNFNLKKEREKEEIENWKKSEVSQLNKQRDIQKRNKSACKRRDKKSTQKKENMESITKLKEEIQKAELVLKKREEENKILVNSLNEQLSIAKEKLDTLKNRQNPSDKARLNKSTLYSTIQNTSSKKKSKTAKDEINKDFYHTAPFEIKSSTKKTKKNYVQSSHTISTYLKNDLYDMSIPKQYLLGKDIRIINQVADDSGNTITTYSNKCKECLFPSGVKKLNFDDGFQLIYFTNGDIKQIYPKEERTIYYYSKEKVHLMYSNKEDKDSPRIFKYSTGRIIKEYPNGKRESIEVKSNYNTLPDKRGNITLKKNKIITKNNSQNK
ncbi:MAG: hypothetical protein MJ252_23395 [archaeon]|nr:hypothetical protein [archaeon]